MINAQQATHSSKRNEMEPTDDGMFAIKERKRRRICAVGSIAGSEMKEIANWGVVANAAIIDKERC